eukprot:TRINITY_DN7448_c0_g1_i1.p1 TRINITY_DN7448_c0_g1~~TRINITY_DN7448_c0_g1_i1.p1  ORF type:complete len:215 (-),score=48.41 TRINITY_DN7448_c0_g1_i1:110-754(-)
MNYEKQTSSATAIRQESMQSNIHITKEASSWPEDGDEDKQRSEWYRGWDKAADADDRWDPSQVATQKPTAAQAVSVTPRSGLLMNQLSSIQLTREVLESAVFNCHNWKDLIKQFMIRMAIGTKEKQVYQIFEITGTVSGKPYIIGSNSREISTHLVLTAGPHSYVGMIKNVSNQKFLHEEIAHWKEITCISSLEPAFVDSLILRKQKLMISEHK